MGKTHVHCVVAIDAPIEFIFERLIDHEGMIDWPGVSRASLIREGADERNGLGAVRRITARGLTLDEEVVRYDPPKSFAYKITRGLPVEHLGTVKLWERNDGVEVCWDVDISSGWPLLAQTIGFVLQRGLGDALNWFRKDVEQRFAASG